VRTGRAGEGFELIDRSIQRDPRNPAFLANRALMLAEAGRPDEAEDMAQEVFVQVFKAVGTVPANALMPHVYGEPYQPVVR